MKKVLFSLFLALTCLPAFAQIDAAARIIKPIDLVRCTPYTWNITGETYDHDTVIMVTDYHPDTVYVLNLVVDSNNIVRVSDSVSANCVYVWHDSLVWKTEGTHTATLTNPDGCDSVFTINLTLLSDHDSAMVGKKSVCEKYMSPWGTLFTQDTIIDTSYVDTVFVDETVVRTCARRDSLILTVNPVYYDLAPATANGLCSYNWTYGQNQHMVITDTLVHIDTLKTKGAKCDSVVSIKVNLTFHIDTTYDIVVCDKWTAPWDSTYTATSIVVHHDTNAQKCVYTDTVNLTVNNSFKDTTWAHDNPLVTTIGCYIEWGDTIIRAVTVDTVLATLKDMNTCDSIAGISVTGLTNVENVDVAVTPCAKPYYWKPLTRVHTLSEDTICHDTLIADGCTTYYNLDLQFGDSIVNVVRPARCVYDSVYYGSGSTRIRYSFRINDEGDTIVKRFTGNNSRPTITDADMDNVYDYNATTQCSTYYRLTLNIFPISDRSSYDTAVACNKYIFIKYNNTELTHSDDYTFAGDDSYMVPGPASYPNNVAHKPSSCYKQEYNLHLTIHNSDTNYDNITACDRYTWRNDTTYTTNVNISRRTNETNAHGCRTYNTLNLTINKTPEAHINGEWMLQPNGSTTLTATSSVSGLVYTWYKNGVMQDGHPETFDVNDNGTHENIDIMMTASNGNGCPDSNYITVTFTNIGIEDAEGIDVNIFPNPASRIVNLRTAEAIGSVIVYNAIGQQVMLREGNGNTMQLDLYGLANGHYTMRIVTTDGRVATRKFIVNK